MQVLITGGMVVLACVAAVVLASFAATFVFVWRNPGAGFDLDRLVTGLDRAREAVDTSHAGRPCPAGDHGCEHCRDKQETLNAAEDQLWGIFWRLAVLLPAGLVYTHVPPAARWLLHGKTTGGD